MMMRESREIFRTGFLVKMNEVLGIPVLGSPLMDDILETHLGGVAVMLALEFIVRAAELIHFLGIPVAHLRLALRTPVRPDAELCIAEPFGHLIIAAERFPRRLKGTVGDAKSRRRNNRGRCRRQDNSRSGRCHGGCRSAGRQCIRVRRIGIGAERRQHRQSCGGSGEQRGFLDEVAACDLVFHRMRVKLIIFWQTSSFLLPASWSGANYFWSTKSGGRLR